MNKIVQKYKIALIQNQVFKSKDAIMKYVADQVNQAVQQGCKVCLLGEFFNTIFQEHHLQRNAEDFSDQNSRPTYDLLQNLSKEHSILIIGGLPEKARNTQKLYNSALAFQDGILLATFRKNHLFDVSIPGGIQHTESDQFAPGDEYAVFDTRFGKYGLGICYDIRFPVFSQVMREMGCQVLVFPSAFNQTTGPRHWELLVRARALDQQVYVAGVSAARYREGDVEGAYQTWGYSTLADPMGQVVARAEDMPINVIAEIDLQSVELARSAIPTSKQRRLDLYRVTGKE